ncbi:glycine rich domain-containing protein, partial [Segatella albensis]|uniref:glycine rich domain-containing protein n=1 Tax=Segatella albensis TaxID=77768 RepID=UPI0004698120
QTFTAPLNTTYKIECWGAQGGNNNKELGGKGGYSIGYKSLGASNNLYVCVGSKGSSNSGHTGGNGGYNGGGNGGDGFANNSASYSGAGGGGGATHISITSDRGELKNYKNYQQELLLVAGGGGGRAATNSKCGVGGGLNGGNAYSANDVYTITGASQNTGYAFGQGQDGKSKTVYGNSGAEGNGGGGGGFYGGYASQEQGDESNCGGSGGSGYVGDVTNGATIAGNQVFPGTSGATETGHSGDGYAIITWQ